MGKAKADTTPPLIHSISPDNGTILGPMSSHIEVHASDEYDLSHARLEYKKDKQWKVYETLEAYYLSDLCHFSLSGSSLPVGKIEIRAIAVDFAGNESQPSPIKTYFYDPLPPEKVTNLTATPFEASIQLAWNKSEAEDFLRFEIERKDSEKDSFLKNNEMLVL